MTQYEHGVLAELPETSEYQGEFVPRDELGLDFAEPVKLSYLDSTTLVFRSPLEGADRFDVYVNHEPLDSRRFLSFLNVVAPQTYIDSYKGGVLADWYVIEEAAKPTIYPGDNAIQLVEMHRRLGTSWDEFVKSAPAFIGTLRGMDEPHFTRDRTIFDTIDNISHQVVRDLIATGIESPDAMVEALSALGDKTATRFVYGAIEREIRKKGNRRAVFSDQTKPELTRRFQSWSQEKKDKVVRNAIGNLPRDKYLNSIRELRLKSYDTFQGEDGKHYGARRDVIGDALKDILIDREVRREDPYEAEFVSVAQGDGSLRESFVPGTLKQVGEAPVISPIISWTRSNEGERQFIFNRAYNHTHYRDGILGALTIAYLSPAIRQKWPEFQGINGNRTQRMGTAQVPVLALMRRAQLLKSPFIEAAESVA